MSNQDLTVVVEGSGTFTFPNNGQSIEELRSSLAGTLGVTWLGEARVTQEGNRISFARPSTATKG